MKTKTCCNVSCGNNQRINKQYFEYSCGCNESRSFEPISNMFWSSLYGEPKVKRNRTLPKRSNVTDKENKQRTKRTNP